MKNKKIISVSFIFFITLSSISYAYLKTGGFENHSFQTKINTVIQDKEEETSTNLPDIEIAKKIVELTEKFFQAH